MWMNFAIYVGKNPVHAVCSFIYYLLAVSLFGWTFWSFFLVFLVCVLSLAVASSPLGEVAVRLCNRVRRLETAREKEYLRPLFGEVYNKARRQNPELPKIYLFVIDSMTINACAMGRHTIAVTKGAMQTFSEEELKGVFSHEIAHILHMNTLASLYAMVGNGVFTLTILIAKLILSVAKGGLGAFDGFFNVFILVFLFPMQVALAMSNRKAERQADMYAIDLGYGEGLIEALYLLEKISLSREGPLIKRLLASHPRVTNRIEGLEVRLGIQSGR